MIDNKQITFHSADWLQPGTQASFPTLSHKERIGTNRIKLKYFQKCESRRWRHLHCGGKSKGEHNLKHYTMGARLQQKHKPKYSRREIRQFC